MPVLIQALLDALDQCEDLTADGLDISGMKAEEAKLQSDFPMFRAQIAEIYEYLYQMTECENNEIAALWSMADTKIDDLADEMKTDPDYQLQHGDWQPKDVAEAALIKARTSLCQTT